MATRIGLVCVVVLVLSGCGGSGSSSSTFPPVLQSGEATPTVLPPTPASVDAVARFEAWNQAGVLAELVQHPGADTDNATGRWTDYHGARFTGLSPSPVPQTGTWRGDVQGVYEHWRANPAWVDPRSRTDPDRDRFDEEGRFIKQFISVGHNRVEGDVELRLYRDFDRAPAYALGRFFDATFSGFRRIPESGVAGFDVVPDDFTLPGHVIYRCPPAPIGCSNDRRTINPQYIGYRSGTDEEGTAVLMDAWFTRGGASMVGEVERHQHVDATTRETLKAAFGARRQ